MNEHSNKEDIIFHSQFGFQRKKETEEALIKFVNNAFASLNSSKIIIHIFIKLSQAFDTINHNILVKN